MDQSRECAATITAGQKASIENTRAQPIAITLVGGDGSCVEIELLPKQVIGFTAGEVDAKVVVPQGDPGGLLIVKPELPS